MVVVLVEMKYIMGEQNWCWFRSQTRIQKMTQSQ